MNPQDEIKARLEVAQLYEEMGQNPKAARYYLAAAEIALKARFFDQGRGFLEKVLTLEPENKEAKSYLERLEQHLASQGGGASAPRPAQVQNQASGRGLTVPTPSVYLRKDQIAAILAQVASAPNPKFFPFNPLPKIDEKAIEQKAKAAEAKRDEQRAKERTAVESSFSKGPSQFGSGSSAGAGSGAGMFSQLSAGGRRRDKEKSEEPATEEKRSRRGGANMDLAESIRRRLQGG